MQAQDIEKLQFIKTNVQVSVLLDILFTIDKSELEKAIESVPDDSRDTPNYRNLLNTLDFRNKIEVA